jgi:hypothetical protein
VGDEGLREQRRGEGRNKDRKVEVYTGKNHHQKDQTERERCQRSCRVIHYSFQTGRSTTISTRKPYEKQVISILVNAR